MKLDIPNNIGLKYISRCKVFLDGIEVKKCFYVDEEEGKVKFYLQNENGHSYIDPTDPTCAASGEAFGKVEIRKI